MPRDREPLYRGERVRGIKEGGNGWLGVVDVKNQLLQRTHRLEQPCSFIRDMCGVVEGEVGMCILNTKALDFVQEGMLPDSSERFCSACLPRSVGTRNSLRILRSFCNPIQG